jgi:hypothetical protein
MSDMVIGHVSFGPLARDITKMVDKLAFEQKEADVLRACLDWLACKRIFAWRSNNIAAPGRAFHGVKGVPDICCVHKGQFLGIECKATKGKQSAEQREFQKRLEAAGGRYILARSLAALIEEMGECYP